jgi:hypothetical protein
MSEVKVNKISPRSGTGVQLGDSGDTITIPSGVTLANNGTATGFASVAWQSSIVTGATHTASANQGLWIDTTSNACTLTLPSSPSAGDQLIFADIARQWGNNAVTLSLNGSKYQGFTSPVPVYDTIGETVHIVYSGSTSGWIPINDGAVVNEMPQPYSASFLVIAGGGGGAYFYGGGGGAGGYRNSYASETSGGGGSTESTLTFNLGTVYTVTVGGGGAGTPGTPSTNNNGTSGTNTSLSGSGITTITSIGGGGGSGGNTGGLAALDGGSGGGGGGNSGSAAGGSGTANQGFDGQDGGGTVQGTGGGAGANGASGGTGLDSSITGSSVNRAEGGSAPTTANTGNGGDPDGGNGQSGVVILRIPTASYSGTTSGSPTVTTSGSDTIMLFTGSGSYTG